MTDANGKATFESRDPKTELTISAAGYLPYETVLGNDTVFALRHRADEKFIYDFLTGPSPTNVLATMTLPGKSSFPEAVPLVDVVLSGSLGEPTIIEFHKRGAALATTGLFGGRTKFEVVEKSDSATVIDVGVSSNTANDNLGGFTRRYDSTGTRILRCSVSWASVDVARGNVTRSDPDWVSKAFAHLIGHCVGLYHAGEGIMQGHGGRGMPADFLPEEKLVAQEAFFGHRPGTAYLDNDRKVPR